MNNQRLEAEPGCTGTLKPPARIPILAPLADGCCLGRRKCADFPAVAAAVEPPVCVAPVPPAEPKLDSNTETPADAATTPTTAAARV
jgi:hypothetical protein